MEYLNLNIDTNLGGDNPSDFEISSQKAIKTYADNISTWRFCPVSGNSTSPLGGTSDLIETNANVNAQPTITVTQDCFGLEESFVYLDDFEASYTYTFSTPIQCSYINSFSNSYISFKLDFQDGDNYKRLYPDFTITYTDGSTHSMGGSPFEREQTLNLGQLCDRWIRSIKVDLYLVDSETRTEGTCGIGQVNIYTQIASGTEVYIKTGNDYPPLKCVTGSGKTYTIDQPSSPLNVSGLSNNDYCVMMTKDNQPYLLPRGDIERYFTEPQKGIWFNASKFPITALKKVNGNWEETDDVPIARVNVVNGYITWVKSESFGNANLAVYSDFTPIQIVEQWQSENDPWGYTLYSNDFYEMHGDCWVNTQWAETNNSGYITLWKPLLRNSMHCMCSVKSNTNNSYSCTPQIHPSSGTQYMCEGVSVQLKGQATVEETWIPISFKITGFLYYGER